MLHGEALGLLLGAIALGAVHGIEPGHGWPVAASYALEQTNKWLYGLAASLLLGIGHLVSSIAMVAVFFYAKAYFELTQVDQPVVLDVVTWEVAIGGPVSIVAGVILIALGLYEYTHGHSHANGGFEPPDTDGDERGPASGGGTGADISVLEGGPDDHEHHHRAHDDLQRHTHEYPHGHKHGQDHEHDHGHVHGQQHGNEHGHEHDHGPASSDGWWGRVKTALPFVGGHSHAHGDLESATDRGLLGIAWFAFLLGFAHEEEFEIIALCAGSTYCLELMAAYALTVIVGIVGLTLALIAGYYRFEERVERFVPYLPAFSAAVLIVMGLGFVLGVF